MTEPRQEPLRGLIDKKELLELVPICFKTLWSMMRDGDFPRGVFITKGKVAWFRGEVEKFLADRSEHYRQVLKGDPPAGRVKRHAPPLRQRLNDD